MGAKFKSLSIFVLLTLAVTSTFIPQAAASTVPVQLYGPEQFIRDPGSPQTVSRDFSVQRLVAQSYTMQVQNGSMEGDSQVSSAVVKLNGSVVLKQNDFNQNVYSLEEPVAVQAANTLEVKLNSMPTSYIIVTVVGNYLPVDVDDDGDGFTKNEGDCNDADSFINPSAVEVCDSIDNNCDGQVDEGCLTTYYLDADGDGYGDPATTIDSPDPAPPAGYVTDSSDCDDTDAAVNPTALEICWDGIDNDCDGQVDEGCLTTYYMDADGDGFGDPGTTIDSPDPAPPAGYVTDGTDCDDAAVSVYPGAAEVCNEIDDNCDGTVDEGVTLTFYADADSDGYGVSTDTVQACTTPSGYADLSGDCDDTATLVNPAAVETCNEIDDNCDGTVDEGVTLTFYADADSDGYGISTDTVQACTTPAGYADLSGDCDDTAVLVNPSAAEVCNIVDDNCDGQVDEGVTLTFYADSDSDGYGISTDTVQACTAPAGYAGQAGDCDDTAAAVNPVAAEICNEIDDNCDGTVDEGVTLTFYADADSDGYGISTDTVQACTAPSGYASFTGDCNEADPGVNPGAIEVCDGVDNNCDGTTDPGCLTGIIADPLTFTLSDAGASQQLLVTGYYSDGSSADLTSSTTGTVYTSADPGIAMVAIDGLVTAVSSGNTTVTATNLGHSSVVNVTVSTLPPNYQSQPEGSFGSIYEDLVPPDVTLDSFDPQRFSVITGMVEERGSIPLADVTVSIHGHPEFGSALTDPTGRFSIPVEGEDTMTVVFNKAGMMEVHRDVYVPWNDIAVVETITMIPEDSVSTQVAFDGNPATVYTHRGTETADSFGQRSLTAVITGDNRAYYLDSVGTQVFLPTITVRATEYDTPESMPAILPPASGFTYCVEMTVDETEHIQFEKPVAIFVDNFLGFEVGTPVPVGYYDRDRAVWLPLNDGVVVRLLDTDLDGVVDALDSDGDNLPDDLNSNGSFADEVQGLEDPVAYSPYETLWRATVGHFTSYDLNYAVKPANSEYTTVANLSGSDKNDSEPQTCPLPITNTGSSVDHRSRVLQEDIPIPGTGLTLHYKSDRVDDYQSVITVPASGDTVPAPLKRIVVHMTVAGREFESTFGPLPNQMATFVWDGLDYQGRRVKGDITANIRIGFVYDGVYYIPAYVARSFGLPAGIATTIPARQEVTLWTDETVQIRRDGGDIIADGWTVSAHHSLVPYAQNVLSKGDGSVLNFVTRTMDLIVGDCPPGGVCTQGYSGDNGPAKDALIRWPMEVAAAGDGSIYINHSGLLRKIDPQGIITTYHPDIGYIGDMDFDQEGNIIFTDGGYVKKLDTSGNITTLAGTGVAGFSGDNGPAVNAAFNSIEGIALDNDGNIYVVDTHNQRVRRIDSDGIITTVAGYGAMGYNGDNIRATSAKLFYPTKIATDSAGNFYIADGQNYRVRKVNPQGIITTVAGNGIAPSRYGTAEPIPGDGGPAVDSEVFAQDVAVDAAGNLYILHSEWTNRYMVRMVTPSGLISTIAGGPLSGPPGGDGGPATDGRIINSSDMTVSGSGNVYISSYWHHIVSEVSYTSDFSGFLAAGELGYAEEGGIGHIFSEAGLHRSTIDLNSSVELLTFGYDPENRLVSITDRFGNDTTIQRDASGTPTSITSPDGIVTSLTVDADDNLRQVTYPDSSFYAMDYTPGGLMADEYHPDGSRFTRIFDANGRVTDALDPEGGHWTFDRQTAPDGTATVSVLSGEGDQITYVDNSSPTGEFSSVITAPDGSSSTVFQPDGALSLTQQTACGMEITSESGMDSEFKYRYSRGSTTTAPSGLSVSTTSARIYSDTNTDGNPDLITDTVTTNGKVSTVVNDTIAGTVTATSPTGRTVTSYYNPVSLLTSRTSTPGLFDTDFVYDARGRLTDVTVGTRTTSFAYDTNGYLDFMTTPDNRTFDYTYDVMGRLTGEVRPDGAGVSYSYDNNGNMTVLVNPNLVSHSFSYTANDQRKAYDTPISGSYTYTYDRDRRLSSVTYPSGQGISNFYLDGNLDSTVTPEGTISYSYDCGGKLGSVTKGTESTSYTYDGSLLLSDTRLGTVNEVIDYTYDTDMRVGSIGYAGGVDSFLYDNDGLLTNAGSFTITRNASNGLPEAVSDGTATQARTFSGYGEVDSVGYSVGAAAPYSWSVTRDLAGRITQKVENIGVDTVTWDYTYDLMGRLEAAYKDSLLAEAYSYDDNGNRLSENNVLRGVSRSYTNSVEDHILTAGADSYVFDVDGFLTGRTIASGANSGTTTFDYSSRGELLSVTLPNSDVITYDHDPLGRRVAKRVNGTITEKYLWQDSTTLLAVYDGSDNLNQRFSYADGRMPVSMTYQGAVYYLTYDQVGSLRTVTDNAGNIIKRIDYDSFGNIISDSNPSFTVPLGFAGGLHDRDTGLMRFGARDYDPAIGKWTAKDPIDFAGGDLNLSNYVGHDPVNAFDPFGYYTTPVNGSWKLNPDYWYFKNMRGDREHQGIDMLASTGTSVVAIKGGKVIAFGTNHPTMGNWVTYKTADGLEVQNYHLSSIEAKKGDSLAEGQRIGKVGNTGRSTAPHLHIQIKQNGDWVDPWQIILSDNPEFVDPWQRTANTGTTCK